MELNAKKSQSGFTLIEAVFAALDRDGRIGVVAGAIRTCGESRGQFEAGHTGSRSGTADD